MTDLEFTSAITVELVDYMGSEARIVEAARVSTGSDRVRRDQDADTGLIHRLIRDGHTSTLEHNVLTIRVDAPIFVAREWMRHRTQSFNEVSGRYSQMRPRFYTPDRDRELIQTGKAMDYRREPGSETQHAHVDHEHRVIAGLAWDSYLGLLKMGAAREVARNVLPVNIMTQFYATANLSNWLKFLGLRSTPEALWEIRQGAIQVETIIHELWPTSHRAWVASLWKDDG